MTRSKGPTEELSLPPTRMRKDVPTANEGKEDAPEVQANVQSQQRTADTPSPFTRPRSRAGTSTTPASETGMLPAASTPFARPDSRAGLAPQEPTSPQSSLSSTSDQQMQEDENTSVSWDLVDTDTDAEVANINLAPTHQAVSNQNCADSINKMQRNAVGLNHELNTLYNQDFFVADTTGRRLSQIVDKSNYSSLLPNGNAALQLRLPDLLIYLKTDTYLVDVKTGHHYAMYHNRIEKMSVLPKLYAAWPYRQLLQAIHDDAVHFGVNSPEPDTSKQSAPAMQPSTSIDRDVPAEQEQQPSPRKLTIVKYEPPSFNLQMPKKMLTRAEQGTAPNEVRMRTTSMHFVNSLRSYLSSKVENRLLGMNERNYSLGDTFAVALQCDLKAIASERRHNKRSTITVNKVNTEDQGHSQLEDTQEIHIRNPNYKGKNYDPNYQARKAENKQQEQLTMTNNQYKAPATRPPANHNNDLARSSDIAGEVTLKTNVDGYQLLKMNELIKNAAAWRARMPKTSRFEKYFDNKETTKTTPKVQINSATLQVMGQTAKDCGYTKDEFIEAVEMYEHFGNINLEDVPAPSPQD